jgi:hypothetical protein
MEGSKGQASYELILIAAIIITLTAAVLANFVPLKNDTFAIAAAREATVAQLAQTGKPYLVQKIDMIKPAAGEYEFTIYTQDPNEDLSAIIGSGQITNICNAIENAAGFSTTIKIKFNNGTQNNC